MTYRISLSKLFREQLSQIKEFDTVINSKKVAQSVKDTVKKLEKMEKLGISIQTTSIRSNISGTKYTVVYKVINHPHPKLIARKIIRRK